MSVRTCPRRRASGWVATPATPAIGSTAPRRFCRIGIAETAAAVTPSSSATSVVFPALYGR